MSTVRVAAYGVSLDGFAAGPDQDLENPLGRGGAAMMQWFFPTRSFRAMQGQEGGTTGIDDRAAVQSFEYVGAYILGRNMFGPVRGPWPNESWRGWWGEEPPYHCPVFVLTHHARPSLEMQGGTTFHFVTEGIEAALERARAAAGSLDVRVGGGVATLRQCLQAGLIDEMHLAVSPILLGAGEHLLAGLDLPALGYRCTESVPSAKAVHYIIARTQEPRSPAGSGTVS